MQLKLNKVRRGFCETQFSSKKRRMTEFKVIFFALLMSSIANRLIANGQLCVTKKSKHNFCLFVSFLYFLCVYFLHTFCFVNKHNQISQKVLFIKVISSFCSALIQCILRKHGLSHLFLIIKTLVYLITVIVQT